MRSRSGAAYTPSMTDIHRTEIDGARATQEELEKITSAYGHFTAMQVRDGATRGLDLDLAYVGTEPLGADLQAGRVCGSLR